MLRSFLAEWPKIWRRGVLAAGAAMVVVTAVVMYLVFSRVHSRGGDAIQVARLARSDGLTFVLQRGADLMAVISLITVGAVIGAEWSQGTLRNLLVQEPGRLRMLGGKFLALLVYVLISALLAVGVGTLVGMLTAPTVGVSTTAWWSAEGAAMFRAFVGNAALAIVGWSVLGCFVAVLVRNAAGAVGASIAWVLVIEGLTSTVWPEVARWLPGRLFFTVLQGGNGAINYDAALLGSAAYVAAMLIIAGLSFEFRDVTA